METKEEAKNKLRTTLTRHQKIKSITINNYTKKIYSSFNISFNIYKFAYPQREDSHKTLTNQYNQSHLQL